MNCVNKARTVFVLLDKHLCNSFDGAIVDVDDYSALGHYIYNEFIELETNKRSVFIVKSKLTFILVSNF